MQVEMVRLRRYGRKLSTEEVRAAVPLLGELSVYVHRHTLMAAFLPVQHQPDDPPTLEDPRVTRMKGESFVVAGYEEADYRNPGTKRHPQAWWCRVPGVATAAGLGRSPVEALEEVG